jgi:hypothetical protein
MLRFIMTDRILREWVFIVFFRERERETRFDLPCNFLKFFVDGVFLRVAVKEEEEDEEEKFFFS